MALWKLILHHEQGRRTKMLEWSRREGRIALGWGAVGNLSQYGSWKEIKYAIEAVDDYRRDLHPSNWADGGHSLWSFYNDVKKGDLVILVGENSHRELVMEVKGESAEWKPTRERATFDDYQHQREARIYGDNMKADALWLQAGRCAVPGASLRWAFSKCAE